MNYITLILGIFFSKNFLLSLKVIFSSKNAFLESDYFSIRKQEKWKRDKVLLEIFITIYEISFQCEKPNNESNQIAFCVWPFSHPINLTFEIEKYLSFLPQKRGYFVLLYFFWLDLCSKVGLGTWNKLVHENLCKISLYITLYL